MEGEKNQGVPSSNGGKRITVRLAEENKKAAPESFRPGGHKGGGKKDSYNNPNLNTK
jgi:hypothetical protein